MRRMSFVLLVLACALPCAAQQSAPALASGLAPIRSVGSPGSIAVWGPEAVVFASGAADGSRAALAAGAQLGQGRVVLFGHSYASAEVFEHAPTRTFVERTLSWMCGAKSRPRLLVFDAKLASALTGERFVARLARAGWERELAELDGVVVTSADQDAAQVAALRTFVAAGGALWAGQPGWGWQQVTGKELRANPVNLVVAGAGLAFSGGMAGPGADGLYALDLALPELLHGARAFEALVDAERKLSQAEREQAFDTLMPLVRVLPLDDTLLRPRLEALSQAIGPDDWPSEKRRTRAQDGKLRLAIALEADRLLGRPPEDVRAHPAARHFPGEVPAGAARVERSVAIDPRRPRWHPTGLYAAPGERITVHLPEGARELGLHARIGVHTDELWHKDSWSRMPEIATRTALKDAATTLANPFGGLIEIEVAVGRGAGGRGAGARDAAAVELRVAGAVEAPLFVLGATDAASWARLRREAQAPWAELAGAKIVLAVPAAAIRELEDPAPLLRFWDEVADAMADFKAQPRERASPERFTADVQISAGYMHSGYPIMTHLDAVADMVSLERMRRGPWGLLHELGHNHQESVWTFEGTGEVTNNVFVLYVLDTLCKVDWRRGDGGHEALRDRAERFERFVAAGRRHEEWCKDPFLALGMYIELQEGFGWEALTRAFASYRGLPREQRPAGDQAERDEWCVRMSRAAGKNLVPFFARWGVPLSERPARELAELEPWSGPAPAK